MTKIDSPFAFLHTNNEDMDRFQLRVRDALSSVASQARGQIAAAAAKPRLLSFVFTGATGQGLVSVAPVSDAVRLQPGDVVVQVLDVTAAPAADAQTLFAAQITAQDTIGQTKASNLSAHTYSLIVARY